MVPGILVEQKTGPPQEEKMSPFFTRPNETNQNIYRIANWNVERPLKASKKIDLAINKINEINPDILILTETSDLVDLSPRYFVSQTESYVDLPNEQWAAIWSKWPIEKEIRTFDSKRTAL